MVMSWVHHVQNLRVSCCGTFLLMLDRVGRRRSINPTPNLQMLDATCMFNHFLWEFNDNFVEIVHPLGNVKEVSNMKVAFVLASHHWNCFSFEHRCYGLFAILKIIFCKSNLKCILIRLSSIKNIITI